MNLKFVKWAMLLVVLPLVASCAKTVSASDPCLVLRQPPDMQENTRVAVFKDKPFSQWVIMVDVDGKKRGCW